MAEKRVEWRAEQSRAALSTARCWIKERSDHTKNCQHVAASRRGKGQAKRERDRQIANECEIEREGEIERGQTRLVEMPKTET